jgi:hypothetical protein
MSDTEHPRDTAARLSREFTSLKAEVAVLRAETEQMKTQLGVLGQRMLRAERTLQPRAPKERGRPRTAPHIEKAVLDAWNIGASIRSIAASTGLNKTTVHRIVSRGREEGVAVRPASLQLPDDAHVPSRLERMAYETDRESDEALAAAQSRLDKTRAAGVEKTADWWDELPER